MSQWLTLSRAAHLLGISRVALQKRIREGELPSFDGMVTVDDVQRAWPQLDLDASGSFEKTRAIREDAFARRLRERVLPTQEALAQRLFAQGQELAELQRTLTRYHALFEALRARLDAMPPPAAAELAQLLDEGLAQALSAPAPGGDVVALDAMLRVMSAHVTVKPSGREFFVEGSESLLKAALRAGLAPNYGCGNGNCGLCKARVVAGETRDVSPSDYRFSEAEKAQNHVLMCSCTALSSDLVLEVLEAGVPEDIPEQRIVAKVRRIDALNDDVMRLHLQTPRSNRLRFLAGQRVTLGIRAGVGDGSDVHGEFPVASCPCDDRNLIFHIRRTDRRAASADFSALPVRRRCPPCRRRLGVGTVGQLRAGKHLAAAAAVHRRRGRLRPDQQPDRACHRGRCRGVDHALLGSRNAGGQYLPNQCRAWAEALDEFSYLPLTTDALPAVLAANPALAASDVYLAGAERDVEPILAVLRASGLPPDRLHVEAW
jgi:CDP-4-dehydro-6-deoxyglucose reductase